MWEFIKFLKIFFYFTEYMAILSFSMSTYEYFTSWVKTLENAYWLKALMSFLPIDLCTDFPNTSVNILNKRYVNMQDYN